MIIDDGMLGAYLDGRLDGAARDAVDDAVARDPLVAARLARQRRLRAQQADNFEASEQEQYAERAMLSAGAGRDNVVRLADRRSAPARPRRAISLKWPPWGGLAVSALGGLALGYMVAHETGGPVVMRVDGAMVARGDLVQALNENVSGQPDTIRIGLSFKGRDGRYCRIFEMDSDRLAGVACREAPVWVVRMMTVVPPRAAGPAVETGRTPLSVLQAVSSMMVGDPLDEATETKARIGGWRS